MDILFLLLCVQPDNFAFNRKQRDFLIVEYCTASIIKQKTIRRKSLLITYFCEILIYRFPSGAAMHIGSPIHGKKQYLLLGLVVIHVALYLLLAKQLPVFLGTRLLVYLIFVVYRLGPS